MILKLPQTVPESCHHNYTWITSTLVPRDFARVPERTNHSPAIHETRVPGNLFEKSVYQRLARACTSTKIGYCVTHGCLNGPLLIHPIQPFELRSGRCEFFINLAY